MRPTLAAALATACTLTAGAALAQAAADTAADPGTVVATDPAAPIVMAEVADATIVEPFGIAADLLDDIDVYTAEGVEIADVEEILGPDAATATHFAIDFDDDAGFGDRDVVVPIEAFTLDANRLILSLSPEDLATLPTWED